MSFQKFSQMLQLQLCLLLLSRGLSPVQGSGDDHTFLTTDPVTGQELRCDRCRPGTYLRAPCTAERRSECAPCPEGSFTELWNYIGKCLRCGVCGQNQAEKRRCTASSDCLCQCNPGFYYQARYDMCVRHWECPPGQGVMTAGTPDMDTECHTCPNGTFSDSSSSILNCTEQRVCSSAGQQLLLRGSTWHDSICLSCDQQPPRDGASYLREILPVFFQHQRMSPRRLRRLLHQLPTLDGSRRHTRVLGLNLSQLRSRIEDWIARATIKQIRELPGALTATGADGAGEKLSSKLQKIDSQLQHVCADRNKVEAS